MIPFSALTSHHLYRASQPTLSTPQTHALGSMSPRSCLKPSRSSPSTPHGSSSLTPAHRTPPPTIAPLVRSHGLKRSPRADSWRCKCNSDGADDAPQVKPSDAPAPRSPTPAKPAPGHSKIHWSDKMKGRDARDDLRYLSPKALAETPAARDLPWTINPVLRDRDNVVLVGDEALVLPFLAEELGCDAEGAQQHLESLLQLLPALGDGQLAKVGVPRLGAMCRDLPGLSLRLVRLKELFPTCDVGGMVVKSAWLLTEELAALEADLAALRRLFPFAGADGTPGVDRMVQAVPQLLDAAFAAEAVRALAALYGKGEEEAARMVHRRPPIVLEVESAALRSRHSVSFDQLHVRRNKVVQLAEHERGEYYQAGRRVPSSPPPSDTSAADPAPSTADVAAPTAGTSPATPGVAVAGAHTSTSTADIAAAPAEEECPPEEERPAEDGTPPEEGVWFFGYGATLNPAVLRLRGLTAVEQSPGRLQGFRLVFDVGGMGDGSAFASVRPAAATDTVHGMLYRFSPKDYEQMLRTENALPPAEGKPDTRTYIPQAVSVDRYGDQEGAVQAFTLLNQKALQADQPGGNPADKEEFCPSWRYLAVICEGARMNGLDAAYVEALAALDHVKASPTGAPRGPAEDEHCATVYTLEQLSKFDGAYTQTFAVERAQQGLRAGRWPRPVYVAYCGCVFDVSASREVYRSGFLKGLAGKDITEHMQSFAYVPKVDVDGTALAVDGADGMTAMQKDLAQSIMVIMQARNRQVGILGGSSSAQDSQLSGKNTTK